MSQVEELLRRRDLHSPLEHIGGRSEVAGDRLEEVPDVLEGVCHDRALRRQHFDLFLRKLPVLPHWPRLLHLGLN